MQGLTLLEKETLRTYIETQYYNLFYTLPHLYYQHHGLFVDLGSTRFFITKANNKYVILMMRRRNIIQNGKKYSFDDFIEVYDFIDDLLEQLKPKRNF